MSAPERIWVEPPYFTLRGEVPNVVWEPQWPAEKPQAFQSARMNGVEYVRADRIAALEAERDGARERAQELGGYIGDHHHDTFVSLHASLRTAEVRAEKAAAEVARLREVLRDVIEGWDWWRKDEYDRDQSVVHDAIDEARAALEQTGEHDK